MKKHFSWILCGLLVSLGVSVALTCFYDVFRDNARKWQGNPYETDANLEWLYQSVFVLYQDLYATKNGSAVSPAELYLKPDEGCEVLLDSERTAKLYWEAVEASEDDSRKKPEGEDGTGESGLPAELLEDTGLLENVMNDINIMRDYMSRLRNNFKELSGIYSYYIRDEATGKYLSSLSEERLDALLAGDYEDLDFLVTFRFDSAGNASIGDVLSRNGDMVRKNANITVREGSLGSLLASGLENFCKYGGVTPPADCTVVYAVEKNAVYPMRTFYVQAFPFADRIGFRAFEANYYDEDYAAYQYTNVINVLMCCLLALALLGAFLPVPMKTKPWDDFRLFQPCLEVLLALAFLSMALMSALVEHVAVFAEGAARDAIQSYLGISTQGAGVLAGACNLAILTVCFFPGWYVGVCARAVTEKGFRAYIRERSLIYRFFPFVKGKALAAYHAAEHIDLTRNAHRTILKVILCNAAVLLIISSLWFGGFMVTAVYSLLLYLILRKYVSNLQKRYGILLKATNEMAAGNLNVAIAEDIGVFEPFKPELHKIQEGFRKAVDEEVKSQKMKAELITNVSHDLKTPLTAIITYVNLLKEQNITEEQRKEYLDVLELKSLRLKALIEDLFEISKADSQNVTLNLTEVDIMSLIKQVAFEMSDKLSEADLDLRMNLTDEKVVLKLDSQKTYRIYENLFSNIAKYAMRGTRVYINGFRIDDTVVITLKNISAQELTVDSANLTERFVRGDASRNTEGSGLGLAIAESFTKLQGGELSIEVDGDLFKATTTWKVTGSKKYQ